MKLRTHFRTLYFAFNHLLREVLPTWLDHRVVVPLLGGSLYRHSQKSAPLEPPQRRLGGAVCDYGCFRRWHELVVDFDLSGVRLSTDKHKPPKQVLYFSQGFMRIGNRLSDSCERDLPIDKPDCWATASRQTLPVQQHDEPVLLISDNAYCNWNPAIVLRVLYAYCAVVEACGIRPQDATLLFFSHPRSDPLDALPASLFKVKNAMELRGVHLFHNAFHVLKSSQQGWQSRAGVEMMRRYLLPAFNITPRPRSKALERIMLISRADYELPYGLNHLERKISNEEQIVALLRQHFPDAEVCAVRLEQLPVAEQLRRVHETDVLIGMHGAALGFATVLPENAGLIELFPANFINRHWFTTFYLLAVGAGVHYRRWINFIPSREHCSAQHASILKHSDEWLRPKRDFTAVPPQAILRRVRSVQRAMRKAGGIRA